jgi:murein DD-endopeptidase MepM/ murein hydrolase activator NlpD
MNIIIVRNAHALPWRIDLSGRHGHLLVAALATCAFVLIGLGALGTWIFTSPRARDLREVADMRAVLSDQRSQLSTLDQDSHRNIDALAAQLGQLQAQATRLNALGERLTQVGKLDDGEFDFGGDPAVGGPEEPASGVTMPLPLQSGIDNLRAEFDRQQAQLDVLENLLRDRKIDNQLLPSGMPVNQGYIASGFGDRSDPFDGHQAIHMGVDFAAPEGTPVNAVADGVVTYTGVRAGYGNVVEIDHGNGYMTRYAHNSAISAAPGQRVRAGQEIASVGSTGRSTGPHCHFEVWYNGRAVNPMVYVKSTRANRA